MTTAPYRGERALYRGLGWKDEVFPVGWCLKWVREQFGIDAYFKYAYQVWQNMPSRYRHVTAGAPPRGSVALYRAPNTSGLPGHIAIGLGSGYILSTDLPYSGRIGIVHYREPDRKWGVQYVGYGWWVNKRTIRCPTVDQSKLYSAARHDRDKLGDAWKYPYGTRKTQYWLYRHGYLGRRYVNGYWGGHTADGWRKWEIWLDNHGLNTDRNGLPGMPALKASARRGPYRIIVK